MKEIKRPYIIGETAFHHEGEINFLLELIDEAGRVGLDAIKFHALFDVNDYFVSDHEGVPIIEKISLSKEQMHVAIDHAKSKNLDVVLLCNDVSSLDWVLENNIALKAVEIHATGLNDIFLLEKAATFNNTVILGIGGSTIDEIKFAVDYLNERGKKDVFLMHGFQNYPTSYSDIFLERIEKIGHLFDLPMGYADHTDPTDVNNEWISVLGLTKGAFVIEKHFTTKVGEKRIDSQAAVSLKQILKVKELAGLLHQVLGGDKPLDYSLAELKYGNTGPMKKAPVARVSIKSGEKITRDNIAFKRTKESANILQKDLIKLLNLSVSKNIDPDEIIDYSKVNFEFNLADTSQFKNTGK
ncbi:N-acetylneuraminate synthase family protein [Echinicola marina]|uniref:N-acetylneuraminate synthase family protein n=1 Tax=Echinicola marina TaxID=2859768 RepID=UPI001CF70551|nr:N-acetylneuraminate synthase family protein [Echinicola marina]UCS93245.1 N-acetylneuraminate synthase family protein [Echinicola marina]